MAGGLAAGLAAALLFPAAATAAPAAPDFDLPRPSTAPDVFFWADHFDYDRSSEVAHLRGHIRVLAANPEAGGGGPAVASTWTIRADELWLDMAARRLRSAGRLEMDDGASVLVGESGEYDVGAGTGTLLGATATFAPWRVRGRLLSVDAARRYRFENASFTSCNLDDIHYQFRARRLWLRPQKWIIAWNTVLWIGKAPVLYSPVAWKSLRPQPLLRTRFYPGYERRNGFFMRTTTLYRLSSAVTGRFFLDYYSAHGSEGPGVGSQLDVGREGRGGGNLYGYRIRDAHAGGERWAVLGQHYETLGSSHSLQARLQTQSDSEFNNHFQRSNTFRVTPELINSAALTRSTAWTTTRMSYARQDNAAPGREIFLKTRESAPRLDFRTTPVSLGRLPVLNTYSAFAENDYDRSRGFLLKSAGAAWEATRTLHLLRGTSLTPRASFEEAVESRRDRYDGSTSTRTFQDAWTGRYGLGGTLRFATLLGNWDLSHAFKRRLAPDSFSVDSPAVDKGIEENLLALGDSIRPIPSVFARVQTGYDFRTPRDAQPGFRARVKPFTVDFLWSPRPEVGVSLREEYQLGEGNRSFIVQSDLGDRESDFVGLGMSQNAASRGHYFLSQELGWGPAGGTWRVGGALREDVRASYGARADSAQFFEKELWFLKDFHDFQARGLFRARPGGVTEVFVRVVLTLDRTRPVPPPPGGPPKDWKSDE